MGNVPPNPRGPRLVAFHAALVQHLQQRGRLAQVIDVPTWTKAVVTCLSDPLRGAVLSRQSVQDITFSMEALGMVERKKGKGVVVLASFNPELWQDDAGTTEAAVPA